MPTVDELAAVPWQGIGLGGMAIFAVYLILTGKLVTRSQLEDERARTKEERERTAKAEAMTDKAVSVIEKVSGQVADLTAATEKNARTDDLAVTLLRGVRRHLGIEEDERT